MKRVYGKPVLCIERFTLSQTIAHNCGENLDFSMATHGTKETCGWDIDGNEIFMNPLICDWPVKEWEGVCYNAPAGGLNVFNS